MDLKEVPAVAPGLWLPETEGHGAGSAPESGLAKVAPHKPWEACWLLTSFRHGTLDHLAYECQCLFAELRHLPQKVLWGMQLQECR